MQIIEWRAEAAMQSLIIEESGTANTSRFHKISLRVIRQMLHVKVLMSEPYGLWGCSSDGWRDGSRDSVQLLTELQRKTAGHLGQLGHLRVIQRLMAHPPSHDWTIDLSTGTACPTE